MTDHTPHSTVPDEAGAGAPGDEETTVDLTLHSGGLEAELDPRRGVLRSLRAAAADGSGTIEFAARPEDLAAGAEALGRPGLGDVLLRTWTGDGWRLESTALSADVRTVGGQDGVVTATYDRPSAQPGGLVSVRLVSRVEADRDGLVWRIELTNVTDDVLEIGELSLPFVTNHDYSTIFGADDEELVRSEAQVQWHENRVLQHLHVSGTASYVLLQRPRGDAPMLLVHPLDDTALECAYQMVPGVGDQWSLVWEGPYLLSVHSRAARLEGRWLRNREKQREWFHGHTSLVLDPGATRRLAFRLRLVDGLDGVRDALVAAGQPAVSLTPGPVAPVGSAVELVVHSEHEPTLRAESDRVTIERLGTAADGHRYRLVFGSPGQKRVLIEQPGGRWTRVLCYAVTAADALLDARAAFVAERQLYRNPDDPYGRHHAFLPFDETFDEHFLRGDESWQVGGADEYGLPTAMFLAERNAQRPVPAQVEALESYVEDFLLGRLQDRESLLVRRGMYWTEQLASSTGQEWSEARSRTLDRTFNYHLAANLYRGLYAVARRYGLTRRRTWQEYLDLAWRTAVLGLDVGPMREVGAPAGFGLVALLDDLEREDSPGHGELDRRLRRFAERSAGVRYPFGSELFVDQTAHSQVYAALRRYGFAEEAASAARVTAALRGGGQPSWFRFGNEQRGNVCCWYGTVQNSWVLLREHERTGDVQLLQLAWAGLSSFLTTVRDSGVARGWFTWWPDRLGFDPRSLDTDMGLYSYVATAKAYVVAGPGGDLTGFGCEVHDTADGVRVVPTDGVRRRLRLAPAGLDVEAVTGEVVEVRWDGGAQAEVVMVDPTGHAGPAEVVLGGASGAVTRLTAPAAGRHVFRVPVGHGVG